MAVSFLLANAGSKAIKEAAAAASEADCKMDGNLLAARSTDAD